MVAVCDFHNRIHLTAHSCVMDHYDSFRLTRNQTLQFCFIKVQGVWPDVDENRTSTAQSEGVDSGIESERRDNDFVAWFDIEQQRRHFQRMSAGRSKKRFGDT